MQDMKRIKALVFITIAAGIAAIGILPGCDELVTNETRDSIEVTLIVRDSTCVEYCHSDDDFEVMAAIRQWEYSGHSDTVFYDDTLFGQTALYCGPECHTMDGFVSWLDNDPDTSGYPFELGCYTCHQPHTLQLPDSTWNFSLRDTSAVILAGGQTFDYGTRGRSNICANCHRSTYDMINWVYSLQINDERLTEVLHAAHEADMFLGANGYEYTTYTYESDHNDVVSEGCVGCHQDYDEGFALGGHSLNIRDGNGRAVEEGCNVCHTGDDEYSDATIAAKQSIFDITLNALRTKLISTGMLDDSTFLPDPAYGVIADPDSVGALYNYLYLTADRSRGMHNWSYAMGLITSSITFLNTTAK